MGKSDKKSTWGGWRKGAGRRRTTGATKEIVSVSVDPKIWKRSLAKWGGKASRLVDALLREYASGGLVIQSEQ